MSDGDSAAALKSIAVLAVAAVGAWAMYDPNFVQNGKHFLTEDKCYGVAKAHHNDCGSSNWTHTCSGKAEVDYAPTEWKFVARGTCSRLGGNLDPPEG